MQGEGDYNYTLLTSSLAIRLAILHKEVQDIKALIDSQGQHIVSAMLSGLYNQKRGSQRLNGASWEDERRARITMPLLLFPLYYTAFTAVKKMVCCFTCQTYVAKIHISSLTLQLYLSISCGLSSIFQLENSNQESVTTRFLFV